MDQPGYTRKPGDDYGPEASNAVYQDQFTKIPNVAQNKMADWKNEVTRREGISLEEAFAIAMDLPEVSYFFYMTGGFFLEGKEGPDGWAEKGSFGPGDAVFFSGQPTYGSSHASDAYEKISMGKRITYSGFQAELAEGKDLLNITPDVQAFANLVSSRELNPPLSIGLFGDWGSGKSFFMNQLKKEVRKNVSWVSKKIKEESEQIMQDLRATDQPIKSIKGLLPSLEKQVEMILDWIKQRPSDAFGKITLLSLKPEEIRKDLIKNPEAAKRKIRQKLANNLDKQAKELATGLQKNDEAAEQILQQLTNAKVERTLGYCRNISQIEFNAWHYVDSNLWASMLSNIFEDLSKYMGLLSKEEHHTIELFKELASTKELMVKARSQRNKLERRKKTIEGNLKDLRTKKSEVQKELKGIKLSDIWVELKTDQDVKATLAQSQELVNKAQTLLGFQNPDAKEEGDNEVDITKNPSSVQQLYHKFQSTRGRLTVIWKELKKMTGREKWFLLLFLGVPLLALFVTPLLIQTIGLESSNWVSGLSKITAFGYSILQLLPSIIRKGENGLNKLNQGLDRLYAAKENVNRLEAAAASQLDIEIQFKLKELSSIEAEEKLIEEKLITLQIQLEDTEGELKAIQEGKRLSSFIQSRLDSNDYQSHLGLISTIRDDFEKLTQYLHSADPISQQLSESEQTQVHPFQLEPIHKIDRIILYIDDLDRCPPKKVVEVLQAIHLILAFPLFVVVVGVDVRWISKSLIKQYGTMLAPIPKKEMAASDMATKAELMLKYKGNATPYDYLEKIFQIPFRLQSMDETAKKDYIGKLLEGDIEKEEPESPTESTAEDNEQENHSESAAYIAPSDDQPEEPRPEVLSLERARLNEIDLKFVQSMAPILSNSPRSIKRFANICRLLRSHEQWGEELHPEYILTTYQCRLFLLAVVTGLRELATPMYNWMEEWTKAATENNLSPSTLDLKSFFQYVETQKMPNEEGEKIQENWKSLKRFLNSPAAVYQEHYPPDATSMDLLEEWLAPEILALNETVSRFSFRFKQYT